MPAWVQMVLRVDPLIVLWLGSVTGVFVPSASSRIIAICSRSRTRENPSISNALMTFILGASTGKWVTRELLLLQLQMLLGQENLYRRYQGQRSQDEIVWLISHWQAPPHSYPLLRQQRLSILMDKPRTHPHVFLQ